MDRVEVQPNAEIAPQVVLPDNKDDGNGSDDDEVQYLCTKNYKRSPLERNNSDAAAEAGAGAEESVAAVNNVPQFFPAFTTFKQEGDPGPSSVDHAPPSSSAPNETSNGTMFKEDERASLVSKGQLEVIIALQKDQVKHTAMLDRISTRLATSFQSIDQLETTQAQLTSRVDQLAENQFENAEALLNLRMKVDGLTHDLNQAKASTAAKRKIQVGQEELTGRRVRFQLEKDNDGPNIPTETFTDAFGRKRKVCIYCGKNFQAQWLKTHVAKGVCLRRRDRQQK